MFVQRTTGYVDYKFATNNGQIISKSEKCDKSTFETEYSSLFIIYNGTNPDEFETLAEFCRFHSTWRKLFFFLIYPVFLTFFLLILYRNLSLLRHFFKIRKALAAYNTSS